MTDRNREKGRAVENFSIQINNRLINNTAGEKKRIDLTEKWNTAPVSPPVEYVTNQGLFKCCKPAAHCKERSSCSLMLSGDFFKKGVILQYSSTFVSFNKMHCFHVRTKLTATVTVIIFYLYIYLVKRKLYLLGTTCSGGLTHLLFTAAEHREVDFKPFSQ